MSKSETPLRSCPLTLAMTLRSSMVLRHVPTMEQCIDVGNSQSFRRCTGGLLHGPGDSRSDSRDSNDARVVSILLVFGSVITGFAGTIVILQPWVVQEKPDRDICQNLRFLTYPRCSGTACGGTVGHRVMSASLEYPHSEVTRDQTSGSMLSGQTSSLDASWPRLY